MYIQNGQRKYIPYNKVFSRVSNIPLPAEHGGAKFEGYANRDSLGYQSAYDLRDCHTVVRGILGRAVGGASLEASL